jgi:hypothetical protein
MVGTKQIVRPARRASATAPLTSATVRAMGRLLVAVFATPYVLLPLGGGIQREP